MLSQRSTGECMLFKVFRLRSRLGIVAFGAAVLAGGATSVALAAPSHPSPAPPCYGSCPSATSMSLSHHTAVFGNEQRETFRVNVKSDVTGVRQMPPGTVVIEYQRLALCRIRLYRGRGSCSLSSRELSARPQAYLVTASYRGNPAFSGSTSRTQALTIVKRHYRH